MARPSFLNDLPKSAGIAYDFIRSAHSKGISARAMESIIRDTLTPISRTTINAVVRGIKGIDRGTADLRFLKRGATPDPRRIPLARGDILTNYSYTVRTTGTGFNTNEEGFRYTQVVSDRLLSREEIEAEAQKAVENKEGSDPLENEDFTIVEALQRA